VVRAMSIYNGQGTEHTKKRPDENKNNKKIDNKPKEEITTKKSFKDEKFKGVRWLKICSSDKKYNTNNESKNSKETDARSKNETKSILKDKISNSEKSNKIEILAEEIKIKSEVPYYLNLELEELKKPFADYIIKEIDTQISLADDKEAKADWIINRLKSAKKKIDFELINENPRGEELKGIAKACANTCLRILQYKNDYIDHIRFGISSRADTVRFGENVKNIDFGAEFEAELDILKLFESNKIIDLGFKLPKIAHSTHHAKTEFEKRLICKKYWIKKLRNTIKQNRWMLFAFLGAVGRGRAKYCPVDGVEQYLETRRAQEDFLNNTVARNKKTGEEFKLANFATNAHTRFSQLHRMSVGIEDLATKRNMISAMVTLTLPGKYHINSGNGTNDWDLSGFSSYKESNNWLAKKWQQILMRLNYSGTPVMGLRVSESHEDGTPHNHIVIYFKRKNMDRIKNVIADLWNMTIITKIDHFSEKTGKMLKKKTIKKDYHKNGKHVVFEKSVEVQWLDIDPKKGRASSYLVKYISKTCVYLTNTVVLCRDEEDRKKAREFTADYDNFIAVAANRSTWITRAFQFFGIFKGAITLWQQYRKQNIMKIDNKLEKLRVNAACSGDFMGFLELMEDENERPTLRKEEKTNLYGGISKTIIGYDTNNGFYQTKFDDYVLDNKKNIEKQKVNYNYPRKASEKYNVLIEKTNIMRIINKIKRNRSPKKHLGDFLGKCTINYIDDPVFWV
jgi:hypothetical protein